MVIGKIILFLIKFFVSSGSLLTRNLGEILKKEDFVTDSEYLITLIVIIPK